MLDNMNINRWSCLPSMQNNGGITSWMSQGSSNVNKTFNNKMSVYPAQLISSSCCPNGFKQYCHLKKQTWFIFLQYHITYVYSMLRPFENIFSLMENSSATLYIFNLGFDCWLVPLSMCFCKYGYLSTAYAIQTISSIECVCFLNDNNNK